MQVPLSNSFCATRCVTPDLFAAPLVYMGYKHVQEDWARQQRSQFCRRRQSELDNPDPGRCLRNKLAVINNQNHIAVHRVPVLISVRALS
jgi:hypothetical protein